jgi:hypothetical protein
VSEERSEARTVERAGAFDRVLPSLSWLSSQEERAGAFNKFLPSKSNRIE